MAIKHAKRKVAPKKDVAATSDIVVVGNYKARQLDWIKKNGVYNYPVREGDEFTPESFAKIRELWLYANVKSERHVFTAQFVGKMTNAEFLAAYPSYAKLGPSRQKAYYVFTTKPVDYPSELGSQIVIARAADFGGYSVKVKKAILQFKQDGEFAPLAAYLPKELGKVPRQQLRVCEAAVQLDFLGYLFPGFDMPHEIPDAVVKNDMKVIDLFAGCGGMSLGFEMAGFKTVLAVEKDLWASETYAFNHENVIVVTNDITKISNPLELCSKEKGEVFGIIGGPPCQGFSLSGGRDPKDPRNSLFMDYMRFVKAYNPSFFVMENVPGILSSVTKNGELVRDVVVSVARQLGYNVHIIQLDASDYGVPQSRQRVFFIGIRNDYPFDPSRLSPAPTTKDTPVTLWQAISDLPQISACEGNERMEYGSIASNSYQKWCRQNSQTVANHVAMRHTKRLVARFHVIGYGESAADVPVEHMQRKRGNASVISGKIYSQNNMRPYPDRPSPTVPASFQSNFVHPYIDRNFTAREGARLQSFPDSYIFKGKRTTMSWEKNLSQYQQIGNAVPPLLAKAIGEMVISYFRNIQTIKHHMED